MAHVRQSIRDNVVTAVKGFEIQKQGHTTTAVFDPSAYTETGFLSCFAEPQEAAEFLTYKRGR